MSNFKNNTYIEDSILECAGGAHSDGEYAYVILRKEMFDAPEDGNKVGEERIKLVREDIYDREIAALRAEIERKDGALSLSLWYMDVGELEARHNGWCRTAVIEKMKQALSTKEDSDE